MAAPQLLIPIDSTWVAELAARTAMTSNAAWKVEIDDDFDSVYTDYTGYLDNNQLQISAAADIFKPASSTSAKIVFRNSPKLLGEGDLALAPIKISAKIGAASFIQVFTGFVEDKGAQRVRGSGLTQDSVSITAYDLLKSKAVNRHCAAEALIGFKICDTSSPSTSIFHHIASIAGLTIGYLDAMDINLVKDYLPLSKDNKVLEKLQDLAAQHGAFLGVRYDGKLRLLVWTEAEWNAATPEYTFDETNIRKWSGGGGAVFCNHAHTEFEEFELLAPGTIYQNYDKWDKDKSQNDIAIAAGEYWPGGTDALAVGRLNYGFNGEKYPVGIDIISPVIGYKGTGSDIECEGGLLEISSWNGSDANTRQNVDSSEIILHNPTGSTVYMRLLKVRGTPLRKKTKNIVDYEDPAIADPSLEVQITIPGDFAVSPAQAKATVKRYVDFGREGREEYQAEVEFTPHMQCGAIVRFHPDTDTDLDCVVVRYGHKSAAPHANTVTTLSLIERIDKTDTGAGTHVANSPGATGAGTGTDIIGQIANRPPFSSLFHGFIAAGGTTTPTVPQIQLIRGVYHGIVLWWDRQINLTNFSHYEVQVSDDQVNWYSLKFDETDWKDSLGQVTIVNSEFLTHTGLGTETLYYKVRRVTSTGTASAYSAAGVGTSSDVSNASTAADSQYVNFLAVGFLSTIFLSVQNELIIGASYALGEAPVEGDQRIVIDNNELSLQEYTNATWLTILKIGGNDAQKWYLQARGLLKTGADISALKVGHLAPSGAKIYGFQNAVTDQNATDPWDVKVGSLAYDADGVNGVYSAKATGGDASLTDSDAGGTDFGSAFGIDTWFKTDASLPVGEQILLDIRSGDSNVCDTDATLGAWTGSADYQVCMLRISATTVMMAFLENTTYRGKVVMGTISGKTVTPDMAHIIDINGSNPCYAYDSGASAIRLSISLCLMDKDNAIVAYTYLDTPNYRSCLSRITWSGTTPVQHTPNNYQTSAYVFGVMIRKLSAGKIAVLAGGTPQSSKAVWIKAISTDLADGYTDDQAWTPLSSADDDCAMEILDTDIAITIVRNTSGSYHEPSARICTFAGRVCTAGTNYAVSGTTVYATSVRMSIAVLTPLKFMVVMSVGYQYFGTISAGVITFSAQAAIPNAQSSCFGIALSATVVAVTFSHGTGQKQYVVFATVSGTSPSWGTAILVSGAVTTQDKWQSAYLLAIDTMSVLFCWGRTTAGDQQTGMAFMRGTYARMILNDAGAVILAFFNSQGYLGRTDQSLGSLAINSYCHASINNDFANKKLYLTVGNTDSNYDYTGKTLVTTQLSLSVNFALGLIKFCELMVYADAYLDRVTSKAHSTTYYGQPWVDGTVGIDMLLDLLIAAKTGGSIRLLSPTEYYTPTALEQSEGTPHWHGNATSGTAVFNSGAWTGSITWTDVVFANAPAGARAVWVHIMVSASIGPAVIVLYARKKGDTVAAGYNTAILDAQTANAGGQLGVCALIPIDANKTAQLAGYSSAGWTTFLAYDVMHHFE